MINSKVFKKICYSSFALHILFIFGVLVVSTFCVLLTLSGKAGATLAGFSAGYIMSDSIMSDKGTMSESQIQTFLLNRVSSCTSKGPFSNGSYYIDKLTKPGDGTAYTFDSEGDKYVWKIKNGHFICMAEQTFGGESAAKIIHRAAQDYSVNPQVLLVLLQKEQGLITDSFPNNHQYLAATGYNCPDNGNGCNNANAGFKKQVRLAARLFREVLINQDLDGDNFITNYPVGNNFIQYNPNAGCGGSNVNIKNRATSALYRYTPYQPNQAALNAGYGGGVHCGAYGNRNFYNYFTDWFGSTTTNYDAEVQDVRVYSNSERTNEINLSGGRYSVSPGQTIYVSVDVKNIGPKTLLQGFTKIGTTSPKNRASIFADESWLTPNRAANLSESSIATNEDGAFEFNMKVPRDVGQMTEELGVVAEGKRWISDDSINIPLNITPSQLYDVELIRYDAYYDSNMDARAKSPLNLRTEQKLYISAQFKNIGSSTLSNSALKLGTTSPRDHEDSPFYDMSWSSARRLVNASEASIPTGGTATFLFTISGPSIPDDYSDDFGVLIEGTTWIDTSKLTINVDVSETTPLITSGSVLVSGDSLVGSGNHKLVFQGDGNLVLYKGNKPLWHTKTHGKSAERVVLQGDGNLVIYRADNKPLWASWTGGSGPSRLKLQSDGNLVIYKNSGGFTWASWTNR